MADIHWTEAGKNAFGLVRDISLIGILGGLVFYPDKVGERLDQAGIVGGSAFGIEFARQVEDAKKQTENAIAEAEAAKAQLVESEKEAEQAIAKVDELIAKNPEVREDALVIKSEIEASSATLGQAQEQIQTTVDAQQVIRDSQAELIRKIDEKNRRDGGD